jgi:hypothetical protein
MPSRHSKKWTQLQELLQIHLIPPEEMGFLNGVAMPQLSMARKWKKKVINMRSFKTSDRKTKQDILFQDILTIVNRGVYDISSFLVRQGQVFHAQDLM